MHGPGPAGVPSAAPRWRTRRPGATAQGNRPFVRFPPEVFGNVGSPKSPHRTPGWVGSPDIPDPHCAQAVRTHWGAWGSGAPQGSDAGRGLPAQVSTLLECGLSLGSRRGRQVALVPASAPTSPHAEFAGRAGSGWIGASAERVPTGPSAWPWSSSGLHMTVASANSRRQPQGRLGPTKLPGEPLQGSSLGETVT